MSPIVSEEVSERVSPTVRRFSVAASPSLMVNSGICSMTSTVYRVRFPMTFLSIHFWVSRIFRYRPTVSLSTLMAAASFLVEATN